MFCVVFSLLGLPSSQPNASWLQQQTPPTTTKATPAGPTHMLELIRQELQTELDTYGVTDPLEVEFSTAVRRLMDSCTKDSIAVSTVLRLEGWCVFGVLSV